MCRYYTLLLCSLRQPTSLQNSINEINKLMWQSGYSNPGWAHPKISALMHFAMKTVSK